VTPEGRASDADRNAVVERLMVAHAEGRLDIHEFEDRVSSALAAKTYGELEALTSDLPAPASTTGTRPSSTGTRRRRPPGWVHSVTGWRGQGVATFGMVAIDILNAPGNPLETPFQYPPNPWPLLVALPWAAVLMARAIRSRGRLVPSPAQPTS